MQNIKREVYKSNYQKRKEKYSPAELRAYNRAQKQKQRGMVNLDTLLNEIKDEIKEQLKANVPTITIKQNTKEKILNQLVKIQNKQSIDDLANEMSNVIIIGRNRIKKASILQ